MITKGIIHEEKAENKFQSFAKKIIGKKNKVQPDAEATAQAIVAEFRNLTMHPDRRKQSGNYRRLSQTNGQIRVDQSR